jgi:hypothetical protein
LAAHKSMIVTSFIYHQSQPSFELTIADHIPVLPYTNFKKHGKNIISVCKNVQCVTTLWSQRNQKDANALRVRCSCMSKEGGKHRASMACLLRRQHMPFLLGKRKVNYNVFYLFYTVQTWKRLTKALTRCVMSWIMDT